jgi:hypothetical protein
LQTHKDQSWNTRGTRTISVAFLFYILEKWRPRKLERSLHYDISIHAFTYVPYSFPSQKKVNIKPSKSLATLAPYSTNDCYARKARATTEGVPPDPSLVASKTKTSDEKRGNPKM